MVFNADLWLVKMIRANGDLVVNILWDFSFHPCQTSKCMGSRRWDMSDLVLVSRAMKFWAGHGHGAHEVCTGSVQVRVHKHSVIDGKGAHRPHSVQGSWGRRSHCLKWRSCWGVTLAVANSFTPGPQEWPWITQWVTKQRQSNKTSHTKARRGLEKGGVGEHGRIGESY